MFLSWVWIECNYLWKRSFRIFWLLSERRWFNVFHLVSTTSVQDRFHSDSTTQYSEHRHIRRLVLLNSYSYSTHSIRQVQYQNRSWQLFIAFIKNFIQRQFWSTNWRNFASGISDRTRNLQSCPNTGQLLECAMAVRRSHETRLRILLCVSCRFLFIDLFSKFFHTKVSGYPNRNSWMELSWCSSKLRCNPERIYTNKRMQFRDWIIFFLFCCSIVLNMMGLYLRTNK